MYRQCALLLPLTRQYFAIISPTRVTDLKAFIGKNAAGSRQCERPRCGGHLIQTQAIEVVCRLECCGVMCDPQGNVTRTRAAAADALKIS